MHCPVSILQFRYFIIYIYIYWHILLLSLSVPLSLKYKEKENSWSHSLNNIHYIYIILSYRVLDFIISDFNQALPLQQLQALSLFSSCNSFVLRLRSWFLGWVSILILIIVFFRFSNFSSTGFFHYFPLLLPFLLEFHHNLLLNRD